MLRNIPEETKGARRTCSASFTRNKFLVLFCCQQVPDDVTEVTAAKFHSTRGPLKHKDEHRCLLLHKAAQMFSQVNLLNHLGVLFAFSSRTKDTTEPVRHTLNLVSPSVLFQTSLSSFANNSVYSPHSYLSDKRVRHLQGRRCFAAMIAIAVVLSDQVRRAC